MQTIALPPEEIIRLYGADNEFYERHFFGKTVKQPTPDIHKKLERALYNIESRYVSAMLFRGAAKTTKLRLFASKRAAFGISRTIVFCSESQDMAKKSVRWIRRQVQYNREWARTFNLSIGSKKSDEWTEIVHGDLNISINVVAIGITGQTRGVNIDDFRPDLIIVDDPCDEENTATPEQRKKISNLFFGALQKSLAPPTESPEAKMVLLQTPLNAEDLVMSCSQDPDWHSLVFSCFDVHGESSWPERFPTEFLLREKAAHVKRNQLALWLREMECKITSEETASFRADWLRYYRVGAEPEGLVTFMYIDPVPPPSANALAKGLRDNDYEVLAVVGYKAGRYFLLEYAYNKGHEPTWTIAQFWRLVDRWKPRRVNVEPVGYQRTLKWMIEQDMKRRGRYVQIGEPTPDRRKKSYRIVDGLSGIASNGAFFVDRENHGEFIEQFIQYPDVSHDDVIEAVAGACTMAMEELMAIDGDFYEMDDMPQLEAPPGGYAP